jgi:hypothetical protein
MPPPESYRFLRVTLRDLELQFEGKPLESIRPENVDVNRELQTRYVLIIPLASLGFWGTGELFQSRDTRILR